MEKLKEKYREWAVVFSQGFRFMGKRDGQRGDLTILNPCYQLYHQAQLVQQPNRPMAVGFMPIMFPTDVCMRAETPLFISLQCWVDLVDMDEDTLELYDEMIRNCDAQMGAKRKKFREDRSGVKVATTKEIKNLGNGD